MKNNKISSISNLEILDEQELSKINGGFNPILGMFAVLGAIASKCVDDWTCFKDGLAGRPSNHK